MATTAALAFALVTAVLVPDLAVAGPSAPTVADALAAIDALPPTPNTAWGIDPASGQLVVTVSSAAPHAGAARLAALARGFGQAIRIERTDDPIVEQSARLDSPSARLDSPSARLDSPSARLDSQSARLNRSRGRLDPSPGPLDPSSGPLDPSSGRLLGGDEISDGKILCSVGFNVVSAGQAYVLTAGHCTAGLPQWQDVGPSVLSAFPDTDYGLIRNDTTSPRGDIDLYHGTMQPITSAATPTVGEQVCASGRTTQVTCGQVLAVDQTVDYGNGDVVHNLIKTNVHTDHGDSGGSLFHDSTGLGMVSGGDGTTDYFQPLAPILTAKDLTLATP